METITKQAMAHGVRKKNSKVIARAAIAKNNWPIIVA